MFVMMQCNWCDGLWCWYLLALRLSFLISLIFFLSVFPLHTRSPFFSFFAWEKGLERLGFGMDGMEFDGWRFGFGRAFW